MSTSSDMDSHGDKEPLGPQMSKNRMRKQEKFLRRVEAKKRGRKEEQRKARERYKEERKEGGEHKEDLRRAQLDRLQAAMTDGKAARVCIDLQFEQLMNEKELKQLAGQLRRVYGSNKSSSAPFHLHFVNLVPESKIHRICREKNDGFDQYLVTFEENGVQDLFEQDEVLIGILNQHMANCLSFIHSINIKGDKTFCKTFESAYYTCFKCFKLNHLITQWPFNNGWNWFYEC